MPALALMMLGELVASQQVFRATTSVVSVDVSVRDGNRPVPGLAASDFEVYDNGVRQTIEAVSLEAVPLDVTVFLGSMNQSQTRQLAELGADVRRMGSALGALDRMRLLTLENQVVDAFGWKAGDQAAADIRVRVGGAQPLYDALQLALLHRPDPGRRHLVVAFTDGMELGSVVDAASVRDTATRTESVMHLVLVRAVEPPAPSARDAISDGRLSNGRDTTVRQGGGSNYLFLRATWFHGLADIGGLDRLREATTATGGSVIETEPGRSVVETFERALDDFRQSYLLRYTAQGVEPGGWHALRVVTPGRRVTVRARAGYHG